MLEFTEFYAASKDRVFRTVLAATGHRGDAEDAVAEAYARAYGRWRHVQAHPNPVGWVLVTALNSHRGWWRRRHRETPGDVPDRATPASEATGLEPALRALVRALPRRQREVVALRLIADLSAEETAGLLGVAPATVHVHLHRALATLRAGLAAPPETVAKPRAAEAEGIAP
jgi:RNA polymerase sigma-70 factor (ECF subfamily)